MKHRRMQQLVGSLIGIAALCVVVFSWVTEHMSGLSVQTIQEIGEDYMASMSRQVTMHLAATLEDKLSQVELITSDGQNHTASQLIESVKAIGFEYLTAYLPDRPDGEDFYPIYGGQIYSNGSKAFAESLETGESWIATGTDGSGRGVILMAVPGSYSDGEHNGTALVAGISADYIGDSLQHELDAGMVESYSIIRRDGSYVSRSPGGLAMEGENFFESLVSSQMEDQDYFNGLLNAAMENNDECTVQIMVGGEPLYVYCAPVPHTDWYLLLTTWYTPINSQIKSLSGEWTSTAFGGCAVILLALLLVFLWYMGGTRRQFRELEEARKSAERASHAKSQFLSNMSHDIRTPMNGIVGMTAIALANRDDPEQVENCLKKITSASRHLLGLINDILDMAKIDSGTMTLHDEQVSLRELMDELAGIAQQEVKIKNQYFDMYVDRVTVEEVRCDGVRLRQIFLNLLSNAIKFTPEGGRIQVRLLERPSPKGENYVQSCLYVEDNGIGMKPEFISHIFESFTREDSGRVDKAQGVGVGMTITKHIVDAMGGAISVKSQVNRGTLVEVVLDLEKASLSERDMRLPSWTALVVDDDPILCESAAVTLETLGVRADYALTVEQAMGLVHSRQASGESYDVALVDWFLGGSDGVEVAAKLRAVCGERIHILLTSAYDREAMEQAARRPGIDGGVSKPLFKSTLYDALRPYCAGEDEPANVIADEPDMDFTGWHVMVAEDNDLNWEIAEELLSEFGMELDRAENGKICVERFTASPAGYYDAILMDLRMPEMTGYEATEAIRALDRPDAQTVPIIAMSADAFPEDVQHCMDCGMNAHSPKPIDVKAVAALFRKYSASGG